MNQPYAAQKRDDQPTSSGGEVSSSTDIRLQATQMVAFRGQGHQTTRTRRAWSGRRSLTPLVHSNRTLSVIP